MLQGTANSSPPSGPLREAYLAGVEDLSSYAVPRPALEEQAAHISKRLEEWTGREDPRSRGHSAEEHHKCIAVLTRDPQIHAGRQEEGCP